MRAILSSFACLALVACKGSENEVRILSPEIAVAPAEVVFDAVAVDTTEILTLQVLNAGQRTLEIDSIRIEGASHEGAFTTESGLPDIEPGEAAQLPVSFAPKVYQAHMATLVIASNDEDTPELEVPLTGEGVDLPTPDIALGATVLDFGDVTPGATSLLYFEIRNVGDGQLDIERTVQTGAGTFVVQSDPTGAILSPGGDTTTVLVMYKPLVDTGDNGLLTIESNDPDEPAVNVILLGNGGGDYDYPVAVIEGPATGEPLDVLSFDGSNSYDPLKREPLTYDWSLFMKPAGSQEEMGDPQGADSTLYAGLAGQYIVQLIVTNTDGVPSAPARHVLDVRPVDRVHVELTWDTPSTDFDLHMWQAGSSVFQTPEDCNFCNRAPDWGEVGESDDDPGLDQDNRKGYGPENIGMLSPADGDYEVAIHYFRDVGSAGLTETTAVTVNVYLEGDLFSTESRLMDAEDQLWHVGTIHWPDATFSVDPTETGTTEERSCIID